MSWLQQRTNSEINHFRIILLDGLNPAIITETVEWIHRESLRLLFSSSWSESFSLFFWTSSEIYCQPWGQVQHFLWQWSTRPQSLTPPLGCSDLRVLIHWFSLFKFSLETLISLSKGWVEVWNVRLFSFHSCCCYCSWLRQLLLQLVWQSHSHFIFQSLSKGLFVTWEIFIFSPWGVCCCCTRTYNLHSCQLSLLESCPFGGRN